jgi:rubrerythrin
MPEYDSHDQSRRALSNDIHAKASRAIAAVIEQLLLTIGMHPELDLITFADGLAKELRAHADRIEAGPQRREEFMRRYHAECTSWRCAECGKPGRTEVQADGCNCPACNDTEEYVPAGRIAERSELKNA